MIIRWRSYSSFPSDRSGRVDLAGFAILTEGDFLSVYMRSGEGVETLSRGSTGKRRQASFPELITRLLPPSWRQLEEARGLRGDRGGPFLLARG